MSETAEAAKPSKKRSVRYLVPIMVVLLLLLVYGSGIFILPVSILASYKDGNCNTVLSLGSFYTSIYPAFIEDKTLINPVMECAVYSLAIRQEADSSWQEALNSYEVYSASYPNGIFVAKAYEHGALMLVNLAKEQANAKNFLQAVSNLDNVLTKYKDTDAAAGATDLYPEIYTSWGGGLRVAGDFEEAQRVFNEFKSWAEVNQNSEHAEVAQREIAQTYMDWGMQLHSQKKFEEAESKFNSAESVDSTFAEQVGVNKEKLHAEWGDFLVGQKDFAGAMEHYGIASKLVEKRDPAAAKDVIANGYIQWAGGLSAQEDFIGALVVLDFAQENAETDSAKNSVDEARSDTYLAFSKSDGEQAQKAMKDAARIVCEHKTNPSLPIFGLDEVSKLVSVYGVEGDLSEGIAATVPGSLHYIACVEEENQLLESAAHAVGSYVFFSLEEVPFRMIKVRYERRQYVWIVTLREIATGRETKTTSITGGEPPPLPATDYEIYSAAKSPIFFGQKPNFADLVTWLAETLR